MPKETTVHTPQLTSETSMDSIKGGLQAASHLVIFAPLSSQNLVAFVARHRDILTSSCTLVFDVTSPPS